MRERKSGKETIRGSKRKKGQTKSLHNVPRKMPVHHIGLTEEKERRKRYKREENLGSALGGAQEI